MLLNILGVNSITLGNCVVIESAAAVSVPDSAPQVQSGPFAYSVDVGSHTRDISSVNPGWGNDFTILTGASAATSSSPDGFKVAFAGNPAGAGNYHASGAFTGGRYLNVKFGVSTASGNADMYIGQVEIIIA